MTRSGSIQDLVDGFVTGILDIIEEARGEHRAALEKAQSTLARSPQPAGPRRAGGPRAGAGSRRSAAAAGATAPSKPGPRKAGAAGASRSAPAPRRASSSPEQPSAAPVTSASPASEPAVRPQREALVLDAVRSLGQATAAEIAKQGGLPNGTAYVVLRSLLARGEVARADTARGVEYRARG